MSIGLDRREMTAVEARAWFDFAPEQLRTGEREGSFILWKPAPNGWRGIPALFRPIREEAARG